jgi:hypothetical protein
MRGPLGQQQRLQRLYIIGKRSIDSHRDIDAAIAGSSNDYRSFRVALSHRQGRASQPATCGRHVRCGSRQSIPSRR